MGELAFGWLCMFGAFMVVALIIFVGSAIAKRMSDFTQGLCICLFIVAIIGSMFYGLFIATPVDNPEYYDYDFENLYDRGN